MQIQPNFFVIGLTALSLGGCAKGLPDYFLLDSLRVLAIKASEPEVDPGTTVILTPLISDVLGVGRTLTYTVQGCLDPGVALGATPTCDDDPDATTSAAATFTLSAPQYTGPAPDVSVTVPATILETRNPIDQANGVAYLVLYEIQASETEKVTSFKRIIVSSRTTKNLNPSIASIQSDGTDLAALSTVAQTLTPIFAAESAETYAVLSASGTSATKTEELTTTWFVDQGAVKYARTDSNSSNTWTPPTTPTGSPFLVVVLRDGRGGEDFKVMGP